MSILEPCDTCKNAEDHEGNNYYCSARGFYLLDDVAIYPKLCSFYKRRDA